MNESLYPQRIHYKTVSLRGRGSALVELMRFDRRVVGSNPAIAAT